MELKAARAVGSSVCCCPIVYNCVLSSPLTYGAFDTCAPRMSCSEESDYKTGEQSDNDAHKRGETPKDWQALLPVEKHFDRDLKKADQDSG